MYSVYRDKWMNEENKIVNSVVRKGLYIQFCSTGVTKIYAWGYQN